MIDINVSYAVTTGNIFGVKMGWPESMLNSAMEILKEFPEVRIIDAGYETNPAFAGAWIEVGSQAAANKIRRRWKSLLNLALNSMSPRWRKEYDESNRTVQFKELHPLNILVDD